MVHALILVAQILLTMKMPQDSVCLVSCGLAEVVLSPPVACRPVLVSVETRILMTHTYRSSCMMALWSLVWLTANNALVYGGGVGFCELLQITDVATSFGFTGFGLDTSLF